MKTRWLLAFFLVLPLTAFATSGACSGHGGVSCSAGADSDGSVICVDGWRNSSVSYASMAMCGGYSAPASQSSYTPEPTPVPVNTPAEETPLSEPVVVPVATTPAPSVAPKVIQTSPVKKVIDKPKEAKATTTVATTSLKVEPVPAIQTTKQNVPEIHTPKKQGFWAQFFSFLFRH